MNKIVKLLITLPNSEQIKLIFDNQFAFYNYNWDAFETGDAVYDDNGEVIGLFQNQYDTNVFLTLNK
jgi:hypothetical protein